MAYLIFVEDREATLQPDVGLFKRQFLHLGCA
jgi:hypothetical protein